MLVLTRKPNETVVIGEIATLTVREIREDSILVQVVCGSDVPVTLADSQQPLPRRPVEPGPGVVWPEEQMAPCPLEAVKASLGYGQALRIGEGISVTLERVQHFEGANVRVRLGFHAPAQVPIARLEVLRRQPPPAPPAGT